MAASLEQLALRGASADSVVSALSAFCERRGLAVLVVMTTTTVPVFSREILFVTAHLASETALWRFVEERLVEQLSLVPLKDTPVAFVAPHMRSYDQLNVKASRKVVLPLMREFVAK